MYQKLIEREIDSIEERIIVPIQSFENVARISGIFSFEEENDSNNEDIRI